MEAGTVAIIVAALSLLGVVVVGLFNRRAVRAQAVLNGTTAADTITKASLELLDPYRKEIATLRAELDLIKVDAAARAASRINELAELYSRTAIVNSDISSLKDENKRLKEAVSVLKEENAELRGQIVELIKLSKQPTVST